MGKSVLYEVREGICTITLNRPKVRNCMDGAGIKLLTDVWRRFKDDKNASVAILTGAGRQAFCAGMELKKGGASAAEKDYAQQFLDWGLVQDLDIFPRQLFLGKPTIAAINGPALGLGGVLALQCDIKLATPNATIGYPLVRLGMFPPYCHEFWDLGSPAVALQSLLTGEPVSAQDAYRLGYVGALVEPDALMHKATEIAAKIRDNAPWAVRAIKMVWDTQARNLNMWSMHVMHDYARRAAGSDDVKEGARAYAERRKPKFKGR